MKLFFAGDVVINKDRPLRISDELQAIIKTCDISLCNLEGPILKDDSEEKADKIGPHCENGILAAEEIKKNGFNVVTLANNHIMDYGTSGLIETIEILDKYGVGHFGAGVCDEDIYKIYELKDEDLRISVGMLAVADGGFGCSYDDCPGYPDGCSKRIRELIRTNHSKYDYFIVLAHFGEEEWDYPLPEVRELYKEYIDLGASAVIGQHTHCIQGLEMYHDKPIFYSVGDFYHGYRYDYGKMCEGLCVVLAIDEIGVKIENYSVYVLDGTVDIRQNHKIEELSDGLKNEKKYIDIVNGLCVDSYEKYYKDYYALIVGLDLKNKKAIEKFINHRVHNDEINWNDGMIYHNISINTHRWCVERAIRVKKGGRI